MAESPGAHFEISGTTVSIQEIEFLELLKESESIVTWRVSIRRKQYVMKIYHTYEDEVAIDFSLFRNESQAYRRLHSRGLYDDGCIPQFCGAINTLDPATHPEFLSHFFRDTLLPSAIFIEYVPGLQDLNSQNYTKERWEKATSILHKIHQAGVLHEDVMFHNVMLSPTNGRVLWIDFDRSKTFDSVGPVEREMQEIEMRVLLSVGKDLERGQDREEEPTS